MNDLKSWTFKLNEDDEQAPEYDCFSCDAGIFKQFALSVADNVEVDWSDLEERANLLTQLWAFCQQEKETFPLKEKANDDASKLTREA